MGLSFLVTGGYFDDSGEGIVWHVDLERGRAEPFVRWAPPSHLRVARKGFAGGCLGNGGLLYAAAHAAVVRIDVARADVSGVLHQPSFNDLHHVHEAQGRLFVANTGLGTVDVHGLDGHFLGSHALLPTWVNHRRMAGEDPESWSEVLAARWDGVEAAPWSTSGGADGYHDPEAARRMLPFWRAKVRDHLHPNHVRATPSQTLATCLYDGTVRDVQTFRTVVSMPGVYPHDGLLAGGGFWLTSIDGRVWEAPLRDGLVGGPAEVRLNVFDTGHAGWCRGLWTDGRRAVVGLTEVRRGRMPRHPWASREPEGTETSVLMLDLADGHLLARVDLTEPGRHSKLYSILPMEPSP